MTISDRPSIATGHAEALECARGVLPYQRLRVVQQWADVPGHTRVANPPERLEREDARRRERVIEQPRD